MSVNRRGIVLGFLFLLVFMVVSPVLAAGALGLGLTVVDENGDPVTQVQTGQIIEYIIDFSCGDLTDGCGDLQIDFPIDTTLVTFEDVITSPGYQGTYPGSPAPVTIVNVAPNVTFDGGESAQARIRVRVREDLDGSEVIPAQVTGSISQSGPPPQNETQTATNPNLDVAPPTEEWSIIKTQTAPSGVAPAPGGTATFRVQFCPDEPTGNISIINPRIVDTFPVGATVIDDGGGSVVGNEITWNLTPSPLPPSAGCQSVTYTLEYPVASFPADGIPIDNVADGFGDNPELGGNGVCADGCTNSQINQDTAEPTVNMLTSLTKTGPGTDVIVAPGDSSGTSTFGISLDLSGANTPTNNVVLTDELPEATDGIPATSVTVINSGTWTDNTIQAVVEITTTLDPTWQPLGTVNGTAQSWSSAAGDFIGPGNGGAPNDTVDLVTGVRWSFLDPLPPGFVFNNDDAIRFIIREDLPAADYNADGFATFNNCVDGTGEFTDLGGGTQTTTSIDNACAPVVTSNDTDGFANITTNKEASEDQIDPLDTITFTLTVELTEEASGNLINPAIEDILPPGLDFVSWDSITIDSTGSDIVNNPYLLVEDDIVVDGEVRDRLLFYWDDTDVFPGSVTFPGPTPTGPLSLVPPEIGNKTIEIVFTAQALLSAAAGPYENGLDIAAESPNLLCQDGGADTDDDDIDNDGEPDDVLCGTEATYQVREAAEMGSQKWIRSVDGVNSTFEFYGFQNLDTPATANCPTFSFDTTGDGTDEVFTRYPCVAEGLPTENFEYLMRMYNTGLVDTDNYVMYDILPFIGDTGVSQLVAEGPNPDRDTEFEVFLTGPIVVEALPTSPAPSGLAFTPPTFTIEYNLTTNPCRPEMALGPDAPWSAGCNDTWYTAGTLPGGDWSAVRSFRIEQNNNGTGIIPPQTEMIFSAPMQIAAYGDADPLAETGEIAWNSFAQRFSNALSGTRLLVAEPPKVGIVVAQRYSVGNRVWIDTNNNGVIDAGEAGLDDVTVELWQDTGSGFTLFRTDVTRTDNDTGEAGYYFFGDLPGGPDIDYQVRIPAAEFQATGELHTYVSSTGNQNANNNNNTDSIDTGRDPGNTDLYNTAGISTNTFTLTGDDEAEGEADINDDGFAAPLFGTGNTNEGPLGRGEDFEDDPDSDLTVDLGFYKPHSIGNRVWLDDGTGGGGLNNGILDGTEIGIDDVEVALYRDDGDGVFEPGAGDGAPVATTFTANGGYYLFDLLPPGQYFVHIVPDNFTFGATAADDGPLADYITSTPTEVTDNETDNDDNGLNPATEGDQRTDGVVSPLINLEWDGEIITETDKDSTLAEPDGRRTDFDSSELTVDFGFFEETTFFSLGNRVWDDINNNGVIDAGETGINGVELALYLDDDGNGIPDDLNGNSVFGDVGDRIVSTTTNPERTLTTANGGYYLFDNLNPGRYLVQMVPENWTTGPLGEYISSTGDTATENTDSNDNGQDPAAVTDYPTDGVFSDTIQLVPQGEPIGEPDPDPSLGDPSGNAEDNNSDLTVDFGVYRPMSLGNRVWLDNGADGAGGTIVGNRNNGVIDANEVGIAGVTVNLYADANADGVPDGAVLDTDTTDAGGYYLFDALTPGNYVVEIPFAGNFDAGGMLEYHESSIPADPGDNNGATIAEDDDSTDHGEYADDTQVVAPGVYSDTIVLAYDSETLNDNDTSADPTDGPARRGNFNEADDNSDLTVDFGFFTPPLSIGNRVWFDNNNSGTIDGAEAGINGVTVNLYGDFNGDGVEDATPITTTTDADGYYLFDDLLPGDYRVELAGSNFSAGVLQGLISSTGNGGDTDDDTDTDENGVDPLDVNTNGSFVDEYTGNGVTSVIITLEPRSEPTGGAEVDRNTSGTYGPDNNGTTGEVDSGSNLTVDFGVYRPLSIGNRVWLDNGVGTADLTGFNNGILDGTEAGIDGVTVELYGDFDGDGAEDATPRTTTTAGGGYYLFDGLPEGDYRVEIPAANFTGVLTGLISSFDADAPLDGDADNNDHGIDPTAPAVAVVSPTITLTYNGEPSATVPPDDSELVTGTGRYGETDANSDLTVDFGFHEPPFSLGNRIWEDTNNDGIFNDGAAQGIENVTLTLLRSDGTPTGLTTTTDADGYYLFDNLPAGDYIVEIDATNFTGTNPLVDFVSSTNNGGDTGDDSDVDENGIDPVDGAGSTGAADGTVIDEYQADGVRSGIISLTGTEPLGEPGPTTGIAEDINSDLTVDFGFYRPMSLGNRVWLDNGADGAGGTIFANRNNGVIDLNEVGIPGVTVNLYADDNADGVPDGVALDTDITDAGGYYLFDNLTPGNYVVEIPFAGNFDAGSILEYHESSIPADPGDNNGAPTAAEDDSTDHGEYADDTQVVAPGVFSDTIVLAYGGEALNDNDLSGDAGDGIASRGNLGQTDANSDLTVDFGFYVPPLSIGNRVWFDNNNNGILDGTDDNPDDPGTTPGIENVLVNLYGDFNGDGVEDATPITTTTDADGYYLFDNLTPGDYRVELAGSNFATGPLQGLISSTGNGVGNDDDDTNIDENGIDPLDVSGNGSFVDEYTSNGVSSDIITLLPRTEPAGGTEVDRNTTGTYGPDNNGTTGEDDNGSNLTVDFAVYRPLSIGNRVWQDVDNNGVQDAGEPGIDGVLVELYIDTNADGDPDTPATPYRSTVTVTDSVTGQAGYYIFDNLPEGSYVVEIAERNFQNLPADGDTTNGTEAILFDPISNGPFFSSEPLTPPAGYLLDDGSDLNDNGIDDPAPQTNGIRSDTIVLTYNTEPSPDVGTPTDDTDLNTDVGEGRYGELDQNADMTIDFGFYIPAMSLGNRVFFDYNNDRQFQPDGPDGIPGNTDDEAPIAGVTVNLFATDAAGNVIDQDGDGGSYLDAGDIIASELTNADGYYLFDDLQPGFYVVVIDENNFRTGGLLVDYISSEDTAGVPTDDGDDQFENGIDNPTPETGGVRSPVTELVPGDETATEVDKDPIEGDGEPNIEVTNSDLTVDFGFYRPMSIGNRVWFDIDDSGTINGSEGGIAGVTVSLYPDGDGDGVPDGPAIDTDVTDADGYYLFDNLTQGGYVVGIDNANFDPLAPLEGLTSSTLEPPVTPEETTDSNDNGFNAPDPTYGIISNSIQLVRDSEPLNETDLSNDAGDGPNRIGNTGEIDSNSDVTVDFGFTGVQMSLGNRVWYDPNDNGIIDLGEVGIENVTVNLFRDNNSDNLPDGAPIATTTTDASGYYLFDGLAPGRYIVGLAPANFNGGLLTGFISSTGNGGDNGLDSDVDENGVDPATLAEYTTDGVLSDAVVLTIDNEPLNEPDPGPGSGSALDINSDLTIDFGVFIPQSIGNRVWFDTNGNSIIDGTETGVPGVTVTLLRDNDGDGTFEETVDTDTTDATGHYLFDGLPAGSYTVVVDDTNFDPGGALEGLTSSPDTTTPVDDNPDQSDHGIDPVTAGDAVSSPPITLTPGTEPTGETDLSSDPADGPNRRGNNGESDLNSDLSVDFGFTGSLMSLGNRVWLDDGAGVPANRNNGQRDTGELGIGNVLVNLYADADTDGVPDGAPIATTITSVDDPATGLIDEGGYYLFDGLAPGNYIVGLDAGNFNGTGALVGLTSSTGNGGDNQIDSEAPGDENGIDNNAPAFNGIISTTINLTVGAEPIGETDIGAIGSGSATDDNSDITVDFGLFPALSLGNRVWFDLNDNGIIDAGEVGIPGVDVSLYVDADANGVPDGGAIDTDTTDAGGYYLFDGLEPGTYLVVVDSTNFDPGGALEGFSSSTGSTGDTGIDLNDNGLDIPIGEGIASVPIVLTLNGEALGESDLSGDTTDGPNFRGNNGESDANSELTVDFGFNAETMSLGNRVWLDDGTGGGTPNNGLIDGSEAGVDGVAVELYADINNDNIPDGGAITTTVTSDGGYYLFDDLPPGDYIVRVAPSNFATGGALYGLVSSTGSTGDDDTDSNDNGVDSTNPGTNGVASETVTLTPGTELTGETDTGTAGSGNASDENSNLTLDFGFVARYDRGDAPDSYGTIIGTNGPAHQIVSNLYLGNQVDDDDDGAPTVGADGDDLTDNDDEDGIDIPTLVAGTTISIESTVFNNTGSPANVVLWIDFSGNGTFDPGEAFTVVVPSSPTPQVVPIPITVPIDADTTTGGDTYARIRVTTDPIDGTTPTGIASNGEVEDYVVTIDPPGLVITKTDGQNAIVVGQSTTYTITISNSGTDQLNVPFVDTIPTGDPNGFDPATISWTCNASGGANCVANSNPLTVTRSGTNANINELIDVPRNGQIVYTITATLRAEANAGTLLNTATAGTISDDDDNGIIFDPPVGTKTGTVIGGNRIRWTMVWLNTGGAQTATITDTLPAIQTFDGNLVCQVFGTSTTTSCTESNGTITWTGTIGTGQPNRVVIAFDVIVPGDGDYTNTASIDVNGERASASDSVTIGDPPPEEDPDPGVAPIILDPAIVKLVNPAFAQPGEPIVWTIIVSNPHDQTLFNVGFTDDMPLELDVLGATSTAGEVTVSGQIVTFLIDALGPQSDVTVTVRTQMREDVETPFIVDNTANLDAPYTGDATARVVSVAELPATGETPPWRTLLPWGIALVMFIVLGGVARRRHLV